jgi:hypothetical protein
MVLGVIADSLLAYSPTWWRVGHRRRENEQKSNDPNDDGTSAAHKGEYMNPSKCTWHCMTQLSTIVHSYKNY